jgi:hypothetical protein
MTDRTAFLQRRLTSAQTDSEAIFAQIGNRWDAPVYSDGAAWTVRQVAIHLSDAERGLLGQMQSIIATGVSTVPDDFDVDRYNRRSVEKRDTMTGLEALAAQAQSRAEMIAWVGTLTDADLEKSGRHPVLGIIPIDMYIRVIARHQKDHAADIAQALSVIGAKAAGA